MVPHKKKHVPLRWQNGRITGIGTPLANFQTGSHLAPTAGRRLSGRADGDSYHSTYLAVHAKGTTRRRQLKLLSNKNYWWFTVPTGAWIVLQEASHNPFAEMYVPSVVKLTLPPGLPNGLAFAQPTIVVACNKKYPGLHIRPVSCSLSCPGKPRGVKPCSCRTSGQ